MSTQKSTNVRTIPMGVKLMSLGLRSLAALSPEQAARSSAKLFCRPGRHPRPRREKAWLEDAEPFRARLGRSDIQAWRWGSPHPGDSRTVFLMHGWAGRGAQLGALVAPLREAGYHVVTWDAPGHGDSPGHSSSLVELCDAAFAVARRLRLEPYGIIGHSMGAGAGALSIAEGLRPARAVWISPPASLLHFIETYADALGLRPRVRDRMTEIMNQMFRVELRDFDAEAMSVPHGERMLVIHDEEDREVPIRHGERVESALGAGDFLRTTGLGHRRILLDRDVIRASSRWIAGVNLPAQAPPTRTPPTQTPSSR